MLSKNLGEALKSARDKIGSVSELLPLAEDPESASALSTITSTPIGEYTEDQRAKLPEMYGKASSFVMSRLVKPDSCQDFDKLCSQLEAVNVQRLTHAVLSNDYPEFVEAHKALAVAKYVRSSILGDTAAGNLYALHEAVVLRGAEPAEDDAFAEVREVISHISSFLGTLSSFWGKKAFNHQWTITNFPYPMESYFAGLGELDAAAIDKIVKKIAATFSLEMNSTSEVDYSRIAELDKVLNSEIVSKLGTAPVEEAEAIRSSMNNWYKALSTLPAKYIDSLSNQSAFYALDSFMSAKFRGDWSEATQKIGLFVRRAMENENYILVCRTFIRGIDLAANIDGEQRFSYTAGAVDRITALYDAHGAEVTQYYINAMHKLAKLFIERSDYAKAWDILSRATSIPTDHLRTNRDCAFCALAFAELANLAGHANDPSLQREYLGRSAQMYEQAGMNDRAMRMTSLMNSVR